ncbi:MAG: DUF3073 domain-containing protein [Microbacteriaceae bacterium]|nr:DUF3073 domain-containing protein [Microbacteriaceae bacterium]
MGRGRQKAKHTKVARELKYFSPDTNYTALERELAETNGHSSEYDDLAAKYADFDEEDDEFEDEDEDESSEAQSA